MNDMIKKRKKVYLLLVSVIIMCAVFSYRFFYRSIDLKQYQAIDLGLNIEQIKTFLGSPIKLSKHYCSCHGASEVWRYNIKFSLLAATVWFKSSDDGSMVVFDKVWGFIS